RAASLAPTSYRSSLPPSKKNSASEETTPTPALTQWQRRSEWCVRPLAGGIDVPRSRRSRMPRYPVKIESLESRWLLAAASAAVDDFGRFVVTGTDAGETIALTSDGTTITATVDGTSVGTAPAADVHAAAGKA